MALHTRLMAVALLCAAAAACSHHPREARVITPTPPPSVVAIQRTPLPSMEARVTPPEPGPAPHEAHAAPAGWTTGGALAPEGCTGDFTVRELRTGKIVASGRARKDGVLLVEVLANGRDGRRFGSHWTADPARGPSPFSVLFLPDCRGDACAPR